MSNSAEYSPPAKRHLRVVRGNPTPEEVAALVAVLTARAKAARERENAATTESTSPSAWRDPARMLRRAPAPGTGAWRGSFHPR